MGVEADMQNYMSQAMQVNNAGYQAATALQMRLNTDEVIREFEAYLRGRQTVISEENGNVVERVLWQGRPIVNELGYQNVMQFIKW